MLATSFAVVTAGAPAASAATGPYATSVLAAAPAGYWRLGEAAGSTVVADASGSGHVGTYSGGVALAAPGALASETDTAATFDGSTGVATVPDAASMRLNGAFSIELWAKMSRFANTWPGLVLKGSSSTAAGYLVFYTSSGQVIFKRNNREFATAAGALSTAKFTHLVVTFDGSSAVRWYVDGALNTTTTATFPANVGTAPLMIGRGDQFGAQAIDEVAMYNTALTATQIADHTRIGTTAGNPPPPPPPPPPPTDPVLALAGDISCPAGDPNFSGANPATCQSRATANLVRTIAPSAVAPLGDLAYGDRSLNDFQTSYALSWGTLASSVAVHPVIGNHDYGGDTPTLTGASTAPGYFGYFGTAVANPAGVQTPGGQPGGWYSYDLGQWHIVVLNHECAPAGGCGTGSPQDQWLANNLATHPAACTMALGHEPRWSDVANTPGLQAIWQRLVDNHVALLVTGHHHNYQRFAARDASGATSANGVRQFIVGTGGRSHETFPSAATTAQFRNATDFGVMKLVLHAGSYDWQFVNTAGTVLDSGTANCPTASPPPPPPAAYRDKVLGSAPAGYWRLGEASGPTVADDSGNAHPGTLTGGTTTGVAGALVGDTDTAIGFDGVNGVATVPDAASLRLNGAFSIELWAKMSRFANTWPGLVLKGPSSTADGYLVFYTPSGQVIFKRNNREFVTTAGVLSTAKFTHLVVTFDGSSAVRWYVDGVLNSTTTATFPASVGTAPLMIGRGDQFGAQAIDEVAVYNAALTAAAVNDHFVTGHG